MSIYDAEASYGCIFCRTGNEKLLVQLLEREYPEIQALTAEKKRMRRQGKKLLEEVVPLFPGYVFFRTNHDFEARRLNYLDSVFRVLHDSRGGWQLRGEDKAFARALFEYNGVIGISKAYYEGDRIRITEGMLKMYEGRILRVNRRSRTVQVSVGVGGQEVTVWLGFELIDKE